MPADRSAPRPRLTPADARALLLAAQGLDRRPDRPADKASVLGAIRRMGALQIDTINVVARSPYLVLWSRLGSYQPGWLDELLAEGALFEYWSHAACFLPIEHYPLYRHRMLAFTARRATAAAWIDAHRDDIDRVLTYVRDHGPVRSLDFVRPPGHGSGWWHWTPDKRALEMLHSTGELMTARRHNFQRVYDLREWVLPSWLDAEPIDEPVARRELALLAARALGVVRPRWLVDYFRTPTRGNDTLLAMLADEGALLPVQVEGWDGPAYVHPDHAGLVADPPRPTLTTLLSPFDPLVWDRARARATFGFDYTIECYTPAGRRRYGYFTLPILRRDALIGRVDAKAHRREGRFEVRALHLESGVAADDELVADLADTLRDCADWHRCPDVAVVRSDPPELAARVARQVGLARGTAPT